VDDLEQPEAGEQLELDVAENRISLGISWNGYGSPPSDLALHLDEQAQHNGQEHEEDGEKHGRKDTLDDTENGPTDA
jgi:hypothetical protein